MERIASQVATIVQELYGQVVDARLDRPEARFGDYATNVALQLAKPLGRNPRDVAEELASKLRDTGVYRDVTVAGPGFINVFMGDASLLEQAQSAIARTADGEQVVVEYSCPNAFKELHTGHLYQTILGDILARLIEQTGATVHRTSFGGDVGLHVAKCLWGMVATFEGIYPEKLASVPADAFARANWVSSCYVRGAGAYEENDEAKQEIDELNKTIYGFHFGQLNLYFFLL